MIVVTSTPKCPISLVAQIQNDGMAGILGKKVKCMT